MKYDHLFNKIPKALSELDPKYQTSKLRQIHDAMALIRENHENGVDGRHAGVDQNSVNFGAAKQAFIQASQDYLQHGLIAAPTFKLRIRGLWPSSIDWDVKQELEKKGSAEKNRTDGDVKKWQDAKGDLLEEMAFSA